MDNMLRLRSVCYPFYYLLKIIKAILDNLWEIDHFKINLKAQDGQNRYVLDTLTTARIETSAGMLALPLRAREGTSERV